MSVDGKEVLITAIWNMQNVWRSEVCEVALNTLNEYEEKAKAWGKYKAHMESHISGEINEEELVSDLKSDYFEKW